MPKRTVTQREIALAAKLEHLLVRMEPDLLASIDRWRLKQKEYLSRPEAIRRLTESGLSMASE